MAKIPSDIPAIAAQSTQPTHADFFWKSGIVLALIAVTVASLRCGVPPVVLGLFRTDGTLVSMSPWVGMSALALGYMLFTFFHAFRYRPAPSVSDADLPTCTVVIPAFNEGPMVRISLLSAIGSDYPKGKLNVVAVDDGSTDDTWHYIEAIAKSHPEIVTAIKQPKNGGKREALRTGFLNATGEVVITVDSDSKLDPRAVREAAAPIVRDPLVAAVAGKVLVLNRYQSVFTRLLAARFFLTFDFVRAVQSQFGAVLCCPGALTAYRRSAVMRVLEDWSAQTFLGTPCTIGEDRALTTWLLKTGNRSVYQGSAIVHTLVPSHIRAVARMLIRWERGNVRESLMMLPLLCTRWRTKDRWFPTLEVITDLCTFPMVCIFMAGMVFRLTTHPMEIVGIVATLGIASFLQSLYCLRSERGTDFLYNVGYAFLATFGLQWIFPYSFFTARNGAWLTR